MSEGLQLFAKWTGTTFDPLGNASWQCRETLIGGERVWLTVEHSRSAASHRHFFAQVRDLWFTLPESLSSAPYAKNPETLRKHALIATGYCVSETFLMPSGNAGDAEHFAYFLRGLTGSDYAVVTAVDGAVFRYTARSQSHKSMPGAEFQNSKTAVLEWIENLLQGEAA